MKKEQIELYSWIIRGKQRLAIINVLIEPKTPKQISEQTKIKFSNVSDVLRAMVKNGLAKCLNPKNKTGRLYVLTMKGKTYLKKIL
jgi:DNA-binding MarR family transcriptional regulator